MVDTQSSDVELHRQREALDKRLKSLQRQQRVYWAFAAAVFVCGALIGYFVAHTVIDPVLVIPGCGGIDV
ncbi:MAG: hypothetical protein V2I82_12790 [Halieaceae bacterium]|jgi:hypothetical protein|nr:hypothetical protein [Halieaceae bacterium]